MMKKAFSLLEIVFVIVVLSVVTLISTDITRNIYMSYEEQKNFAEAEFKSKIVVELIGARLNRSIFKSIVDGNEKSIANVARADKSTIIKWIDKDIEGLRGVWDTGEGFVKPAYSGFADLVQSKDKTIKTSDCDLGALSGANSLYMQLTGSNSKAIYFPYANSDGSAKERFWSNPKSLFSVDISNATTLTIQAAANTPSQIGENYYLTNHANAIEFKDNTLFFYDNFRPWLGNVYKDGRENILAENISSFEFWGESDGAVVRFRVCATSQNDSTIIVCKEGAAIE